MAALDMLDRFIQHVSYGDSDALVTDYRNIAQTLGGCPTNEAVGRFTTVSVLNTALQESYIAERCGMFDSPHAAYISTVAFPVIIAGDRTRT